MYAYARRNVTQTYTRKMERRGESVILKIRVINKSKLRTVYTHHMYNVRNI